MLYYLLPSPRLYTYRVPQELIAHTAIGKRVAVQFGKRKVYAAVVHSFSETPPKDYEAKYILDVLDETPLISEKLLRFWDWMAIYYMCTPGDVMNAALPASFRLESTTSVQLNPECDLQSVELSDKEYLITEALTLTPELNLEQLSDITQQKHIFPLLKSLYLKEVILLTEELKESYTPKTTLCIRLTEQYTKEEVLSELFAKLEKQPKQTDALLAFLHLAAPMKRILKKVTHHQKWHQR